MNLIRKTIKRRRQEGKTDYKARLNLLKSEKPRVAIRISNMYITGQIIRSEIAKDNVQVSVNSKDLLGLGWPENHKGSLKNLQASYLTGYLLGVKSKSDKAGILDIGLNNGVKGSRLYAFLKGLKDSGFEIKCGDGILPSEERMKLDGVKFNINKILEKIKNG